MVNLVPGPASERTPKGPPPASRGRPFQKAAGPGLSRFTRDAAQSRNQSLDISTFQVPRATFTHLLPARLEWRARCPTATGKAIMGTQSTSTGRRNLVGNTLVTVGALSSAFGAVGWLSALRSPSILTLALGFVLYGVLPVLVGVTFLWRGLGMIEEVESARRVDAVSRAALLDALRGGGATAREVAAKLCMPSTREAERALDRLVRDDLAKLDVTDDGELVYRRDPETILLQDRDVN